MRPGLVRVAQENVPNTLSGTAHLTRLVLRATNPSTARTAPRA
ncbi:MAG: hypothetical protein U0325_15745 [Polyangiales bacterium]